MLSIQMQTLMITSCCIKYLAELQEYDMVTGSEGLRDREWPNSSSFGLTVTQRNPVALHRKSAVPVAAAACVTCC